MKKVIINGLEWEYEIRGGWYFFLKVKPVGVP
jgi:hypothetical protein